LTWLPNWIRRGWKTSGGDPVKNRDLWQRLEQAARRHDDRVAVGASGHSGDPDNERVDALARAAAEAQRMPPPLR
jgi:ribonuclease HI